MEQGWISGSARFRKPKRVKNRAVREPLRGRTPLAQRLPSTHRRGEALDVEE